MKFIFGVVLFLVGALSSVYSGQRPNILFLLVDDQRPDTIGAYGNPKISTPNLDNLARRGMKFTRATCSYPICHISRAEMLSGMHGWENGINGMGGRKFQEGITYWAAALKDSGYQTCYVGKWHTPGRPSVYGYDTVEGLYGSGGGKWWKEGATDWKGFPITGYKGWVFQDMTGKVKYPEQGVGLTPDIDAKFADAAITAIEKADTKSPWFIHVNFTGPHDPLFVPPGYEGKYKNEDMPVPENFLPEHPFDHGNLKGRDEMLMPFPRTREGVQDLLRVYYSVIDHIDAQVGRIVDTLEKAGQLDNTCIIYASDHGMGVGSHGLRGKQSQYEHTTNVPLIIAGPGIANGATSSAQVYLRELYPTTCDLTGTAIPENVTGKSFAGVLTGREQIHHKVIHGYFTDAQRMIRTDRWKYVEYPQAGQKQLFDLQNDPAETNNLISNPEQKEVAADLADRLDQWRQKTDDPLLRVSR